MAASHPFTVRHPHLSHWQAILHEALAAQHGNSGLHVTKAHPAMQATAEAIQELQSGNEVAKPRRPHPSSACARLFVRLVWAHARGDRAQISQLQSELRYLSCDPLWLETWAAFELARARGQSQGSYRRHQRLDDFVLPPLPETATVALLADWGTGMPDARGLLRQVATFAPDVVLHLGDIYYAGTWREMNAHFLHVFQEVFGQRCPRVYVLAGNHDRYSGGDGFTRLLDSLQQPASYFSLRNQYWQLLAMDTGLHDANPLAHGGTLTWLEESEVEWLQHHLEHPDAGLPPGARRGTLLFSHHPYFSMAGTGKDVQGHLLAVNPHLRAAFGPYLAEVAYWFWGHEHNLLVCEPYAGLRRGRCIGAAAVPRLVHQQVNAPVPGLHLPDDERGPPVRVPGTALANDGLEDFHAYAVLRLDGPVATVRYYQVSTRELVVGMPPPPPLFTESVILQPV
jgi:hypothetical protein